MKIFITGGTGFIGRHTLPLLLSNGYQLNVLIRKSSETSFLRDQGVALVEGDLCDRQSVLDGMQGCDGAIHMGACYSFWQPRKEVYSTVNIEGTRNVMECALEAGIKKVVHVSTAGVFGKPEKSPFCEDCDPGPVQFSEYFRTKCEADKVAWGLHEKRGLPLVVIYPACVLGGGDPKASGTYIHNLINRKLPAGVFKNSEFSFVYVKDVAQAILSALEKEGNIGERYLVGNFRCSWEQMNTMVTDIAGVRPPRFYLPASMTMMNAYLLTGLANLVRRPPLWGMSVDQMKVMKAGFSVDGSKAERELGIHYTPIRFALEEEIRSFSTN